MNSLTNRFPQDQPSYGATLNRERLLGDADRLFSIRWLINRLFSEIKQLLIFDYNLQSHKFFFAIRQQPELWFAWHMLKHHQASLAKVEEYKQMFPENGNFIEALREERENVIKQFMKFVPSKQWDTLRDNDDSWRIYAKRLYQANSKNPLIELEFFALVDYICVMTDALCGNWNLLFPSDEDNTDMQTYIDQSATSNNQEMAEIKTVLKTLLKSAWFDKFCDDSKKYDTHWRDNYIDALFKSDYGQELVIGWDKKQIQIKGYVLGCLYASGVFCKGVKMLAIAKEILSPFYPTRNTDAQVKQEWQKKSSSLSNYMGQADQQEFYDWAIKFIEAYDNQKLD